MRVFALATIFATCLFAQFANAETICTVVIDTSNNRALYENGDCDRRVTPASTFKIALALIGYDAGILKSRSNPKLPFKKGYVDWGGSAWRQATTPQRWMKYSVIWYSQQLAKRLGAASIARYLRKLEYGNADFSGDKGYNNALERAWVASSLTISPNEQARFLARLVNSKQPVSNEATKLTMSIVETTKLKNGWVVHGKTGLAFPRRADRSFDRNHGWGWFVGWATKGDKLVVFARLIQDTSKQSTTPSTRAKNSILRELPDLVTN